MIILKKFKLKLIGFVLLVVMLSLTSFINVAYAKAVTVSSSATDTHTVTLVHQGEDYVGSVKIPVKVKKNGSMSPDSVVVNMSLALKQDPLDSDLLGFSDINFGRVSDNIGMLDREYY